MTDPFRCPTKECDSSSVHSILLAVAGACDPDPQVALTAALAALGLQMLDHSGVICELCPLPPPWFIRCESYTTGIEDEIVFVGPRQNANGDWCWGVVLWHVRRDL